MLFTIEVKVMAKDVLMFVFPIEISAYYAHCDKLTKIAQTCSRELASRKVQIDADNIIDLIKIVDLGTTFPATSMPITSGSQVVVEFHTDPRNGLIRSADGQTIEAQRMFGYSGPEASDANSYCRLPLDVQFQAEQADPTKTSYLDPSKPLSHCFRWSQSWSKARAQALSRSRSRRSGKKARKRLRIRAKSRPNTIDGSTRQTTIGLSKSGQPRPTTHVSGSCAEPRKKFNPQLWCEAEKSITLPRPHLAMLCGKMKIMNSEEIPNKMKKFSNFVVHCLAEIGKGEKVIVTRPVIDQLWQIVNTARYEYQLRRSGHTSNQPVNREMMSVANNAFPDRSSEVQHTTPKPTPYDTNSDSTLVPQTPVRPFSAATQTTLPNLVVNYTPYTNQDYFSPNGHSVQYNNTNVKTESDDSNIEIVGEVKCPQQRRPFPVWPSATSSSLRMENQSKAKSHCQTSRGSQYTFWVQNEDSDEKVKISVDDMNSNGATVDAVIEVIKQKFAGRSPPKRRIFEVFDENTGQYVGLDDDMTSIPNGSLIRVLAEPDIQFNNRQFDGHRRHSANPCIRPELRSSNDKIDHWINFWLIESLKELNYRFNRSDDLWEEVSQELRHRLPDQSITANECQLRFYRLFDKYSSALKTAKTISEANNSFELFNCFSQLDLKSILAKTDLIRQIQSNI